jgi:hypothetical protein
MFKNLDRFQVSASSTTELRMSPFLGSKAVLVLAPATDANPNYHNSFLKMTAKVRKDLSNDSINSDSLALVRDIQRELFGRFVIKSWSGVEGEPGGEGVNEDGLVPYSRENAQKLCRVLPNELFDMLTAEAGAARSFYDEPADLPPTAEELDELAGN